ALCALACSSLRAASDGLPNLNKEEIGPGLDPSPLVIPAVTVTSPRQITSTDLLTLRDLRGVSLSPDGANIAFVVSQAVYKTNSYRSGLFVVSTRPGANPVSLGNAGPPFWSTGGQWLPQPPQWSSDGKHVAYRLKTSGTWQVWQWS